MEAMKGNFVYLKIGKRIALIRKKQKLSQDHLAFIADMDRTYLTRLEKGRANPSVRTLHKIARKLKVKVSFLLRDI
jgi:transcriptional regulator with XRE-family HTH domain